MINCNLKADESASKGREKGKSTKKKARLLHKPKCPQFLFVEGQRDSEIGVVDKGEETP